MEKKNKTDNVVKQNTIFFSPFDGRRAYMFRLLNFDFSQITYLIPDVREVKVQLGFSLIFTNCRPGDMTSFQYRIIMSTRRITKNSCHFHYVNWVNTQWRACSSVFAPFQIRGLLMLKFDYFCNHCTGRFRFDT